MDGLTLLAEARAAGLTVEADGPRLVVRGPKRAATVARRLLDQKRAVMEALQTQPGPEPTPEATAVENIEDTASAMGIMARCQSASVWPTAMGVETTPANVESLAASDGTRAASRFAGWVQRPDATGRMGWEAPNLPGWQRWWAGSTFEELPDLPSPCPQCHSLELWQTMEGGWRCLHCERAEFERSQELARLAHRLRAASGLPPRQAEAEAEPLAPGGLRCDRCKSTQLIEATTHGGQTVRLDCARCGRFVAWKVWYGKLLVESEN